MTLRHGTAPTISPSHHQLQLQLHLQLNSIESLTKLLHGRLYHEYVPVAVYQLMSVHYQECYVVDIYVMMMMMMMVPPLIMNMVSLFF
jgi:hypothetical protein